MTISRFTKPELDHFKELCNFTDEESELFGLRAKSFTLEMCAELMNVSVSTIKRISKRMTDKISRIM